MRPYYLIFFLALGAVIYLLYRRGLAVTKCIAAVLFVFYPGREKDRAKLNSCNGWVRHVGRFRQGQTYEFSFGDQLSKGEAEVSLLDREKRPLLKLNRQSPTGTIKLGENGRYYLRWDFQNATGQCELSWREMINERRI